MEQQAEQVTGRSGAPPPRRGLASRIIQLLASVPFASVIVLLIALACIAGTLIPQGGQVEGYLASHPASESWFSVMGWLGLTHVFYSWWFLALLMLLAASLVVCTSRRFQAMRMTSGAIRLRITGSFISHVSLLTILAGGVVRAVWSEKGMIAFREGEAVSQCGGEESPMPLPFSIRLVRFELEHYAPPSPAAGERSDRLFVRREGAEGEQAIDVKEGVSVRLATPSGDATGVASLAIERVVPDFVMDGATGEVKSRGDQFNNPAIQVAVTDGGVTNRAWVFARFPRRADASMPYVFRYVVDPLRSAMASRGMPIKAYKSTVEIIDEGKVVLQRQIAVNSPLSYKGYTFYQTSYNPDDLSWTQLQVVRDPSVPIVYGGFMLMMVGLTIVFCVGPYLDEQRKKKSGGVA